MRGRELLRFLGPLFAVAACGYHTVYGDSAEHLHVVLLRSLIPDAVASDEVLSGVRETLAREGSLAAGEGYPRIEIEVLRADEGSEGIAAPSTALGGSVSGVGSGSGSAATLMQGPRARATEVGLVARACLVRQKGGTCERDTGDTRAMDLVASDLSAGAPLVTADLFHHRDAMRDVGRRLGVRLAEHVLGIPTASDESIGRER